MSAGRSCAKQSKAAREGWVCPEGLAPVDLMGSSTSGPKFVQSEIRLNVALKARIWTIWFASPDCHGADLGDPDQIRRIGSGPPGAQSEPETPSANVQAQFRLNRLRAGQGRRP